MMSMLMPSLVFKLLNEELFILSIPSHTLFKFIGHSKSSHVRVHAHDSCQEWASWVTMAGIRHWCMHALHVFIVVGRCGWLVFNLQSTHSIVTHNSLVPKPTSRFLNPKPKKKFCFFFCFSLSTISRQQTEAWDLPQCYVKIGVHRLWYFIVTYYVELCSAIDSYYICHCIPTTIKEVVSTLYKVNDLNKITFLAKKLYHCVIPNSKWQWI